MNSLSQQAMNNQNQIGSGLREPQFVTQDFLIAIPKLSNKGWKTHPRVVQLDASALSYYRNVPRSFARGDLQTMKGAQPKRRLKLMSIKEVQAIGEDDQQRFKKLKSDGGADKYFKVLFYQEGMSNGNKGAGSDSDDHDHAGGPKNSQAKPEGTWYLQAGSKAEREELISQIYMNSMNRWEVHGWNNISHSHNFPPDNALQDETTRQLVMDRIAQWEQDGRQMYTSKNSPSNRDHSDDEDEEAENSKGDQEEESSSNHSDSGDSEDSQDLLGEVKRRKVNDIGFGERDQAKDNQQNSSRTNEANPKDDHYRFILNQNMNINNAERDGRGGARGKQHGGQGQGKDDPILTADDVQNIIKQLDKHEKEELDFERQQEEKERKGWDLKFQNYWGYIIKAGGKSKQCIAMCEMLFKHVGEFRSHATEHVKKIVDNMHDPELQTRYNEPSKKGSAQKRDDKDNKSEGIVAIPAKDLTDDHRVFLDEADESLYLPPGFTPAMKHASQFGDAAASSMQPQNAANMETSSVYTTTHNQFYEQHKVYVHDNILFKFTSPNEFVYTTGDSLGLAQEKTGYGNNQFSAFDAVSNAHTVSKNPVSEGAMTNLNDKSSAMRGQLKNIQKRQKWKQFGRQFLSMDVLFDALFLLSKADSEYKLRVPISALIDYKGFRCLAIAQIPILPPQGPSLGFFNSNYLTTEPELKKALTDLGDLLRLKENDVLSDGQRAKDRQVIGHNSTSEKVPISYFVKVYNQSLPQDTKLQKNQTQTAKQSAHYHYNALEYMEKIYYVLKTTEIFPYDIEITDHKGVIRAIINTLRPEFTTTYTENKNDYLLADTMKQFQKLELGFDPNNEKMNSKNQNILDISNASKCLKNQVITQFVTMLDDLQIMPVDTESLTEAFHQQGINMQYLSHILVLSQVPHVKEICIVEMLARTCKNILNRQLSELIMENKIEYEQLIVFKRAKSRQLSEKDKFMGGQQANRQSKNYNEAASKTDADRHRLAAEIAELRGDLKRIDEESSKRKERTPEAMNEETQKFMVDMLNLIFGRSEESDYFWDSILMPECMGYFKIQEAIQYHQCTDTLGELIDRRKVNYNALYFALYSLMGLDIDLSKDIESVDQDKKAMGHRSHPRSGNMSNVQQQNLQYQKLKEIFRSFGNAERPFGVPEEAFARVTIKPKSKCFGLRNIPYRELYGRMIDYKNKQNYEEAIRCAEMKQAMSFALNQEMDLITLADLAEMALDQNQYQTAIRYAERGIQDTLPLHAERVRFYTILVRANYAIETNESINQGERFFKLLTETVETHLGPSHPLHITVYGIMASLMIPKAKMEEAMYLYKSSILCSMKTLGPNHVQTAHIHVDMGQFYLKWNNKEQALQHFEQAFQVYKQYFTQRQQNENQVLQADAAMQVANIMEAQNRLNDSQKYVQIAYQTYTDTYGPSSDNTIIALWLKLQIEYSQSNSKGDQVINLAETLFRSLVQRDEEMLEKYYKQMSEKMDLNQQDQEDHMYAGYENVDELKEEMEKIKVLCIATHILEMTRYLEPLKKKNLEDYCDKVMLSQQHESDAEQSKIILKKHMDYKSKHIDLQSIRKISNLEFRDQDEEFMKSLYKRTKNGGFRQYYLERIQDAAENRENLNKPRSGREQVVVSVTKNMESNLNANADANAQRTPAIAPKSMDLVEGAITRDPTQEFFEQLLDAFYEINFYNLLHSPEAKGAS